MSAGKFAPFSPNQIQALIGSVKPFNLWEGAIRSGKTFLSIAWLINKITTLPLPGIGMLLGQTAETIERNFLNDFMEIVGEGSYHYVKGKYIDVFFQDPTTGERKTRRMHIVGARDKGAIKRVRGSTLMIGYIDEASLMPKDVFDELVGRLSYKESVLLATTNPDSPNHWLLRDYVEHPEKAQDWTRFKFTLADNMALSNEYKERVKRQYAGIPARYQRMIEGKWVLAEGLVYSIFDKAAHTFKRRELAEKPLRYYVGGDYGDQNPTVFLLIGEFRAKGRNYYRVLDEYYYSGRETHKPKTVGQYVEDYEAWIGKHTKDGGRIKPEIILDPSAKALIREFEKRGHFVTQAKNNVSDGIGVVANFIHEGRLFIGDQCVKLLEEFGLYVWDEKAQDRGLDVPIKSNDHALDALRYVIYTMNQSYAGVA